jgi:LmbE family N-acetylglucosaminyl deacetylase
MDRSSISLELRLIKEKIGRRISIAESLSNSAWDPKKVEVPPGDRFLVISPHPDDDVIGSAGTILKLLSLKKQVRTVFLSLPSRDSPSKEARKAEVLQSLRILGQEDFSLCESEFPASVRGVADLITPELERWKPDCIFVPSPLENQNQHLMAFEGYSQALRSSNCKAATALYEVWGMVIPNLVVDIVRMARSLNEYRAISSNMKGFAEAFLYLEREELLKYFA